MLIASRVIVGQQNRTRKILDLKCDACQREFVCSHCVKSAERKTTHYCSTHCAHTAPAIRQQRKISGRQNAERIKATLEQTCLERYGVKSYFETEEFQNKRVKSLMERFGVDHQSKCYEISSKQQRGRGRVTQITHWKTSQILNCEASYEVAFVSWCNLNKFDFDWQIPHKMPDGHVYIVDALIKDGEFTNTWIEIKGYMTPVAKIKWDWFHFEHPNDSQLWNRQRLEELKILIKGKPNPEFCVTIST